jgi:hypothetical protein
LEGNDEAGRAHHGEESTREEIQDTYSVNPEMRSSVGDISPGLLIEEAPKRASAAPGRGTGEMEGSDGTRAAESTELTMGSGKENPPLLSLAL